MALDPWFDACILLKHTLLIVSFSHFFSFLRARRVVGGEPINSTVWVYIERGPAGRTARREPELEERTASDPWFDAFILPKHSLLIVSCQAIFFFSEGL